MMPMVGRGVITATIAYNSLTYALHGYTRYYACIIACWIAPFQSYIGAFSKFLALIHN